jgi:hypothetical protein
MDKRRLSCWKTVSKWIWTENILYSDHRPSPGEIKPRIRTVGPTYVRLCMVPVRHLSSVKYPPHRDRFESRLSV